MSKYEPIEKSVTIIGAGLAGLTAARKLHAAGWQTTVLEARGRVGGRVFTLHEGFAGGQYAEGGGEFIEAFHHRMIGLAKEFGLALAPVGGMEAWGMGLALEGRVGRADDVALWGADLTIEAEKLWGAFSLLGQHVPDPARPQDSPDAAQLDAQSIAHWLADQPVHPLAKKVFATRLRSEFTVELEELSLLDMARWSSFYYADTGAGRNSFRVQGGNDLIPQRMAAALPDVRLNAVVMAVKQEASGVAISYRDQTGLVKVVRSGFAVIAVPFGPLRTISFDPPLPLESQAMVDGLTYGVVTKVMIQYAPPLSELGWGGRILTDLPMTCTWHASGGQPGTYDIVTVYTGAEAGKAFTALDEAARIREAVAQVERVCPGSAARVVGARTMAWANEPFTQGAYAAFKPGEVLRFWEGLRDPVGRVYFAGEHIAVHQGYMEGAVESGERAAEEIRLREARS